MKKRVVTVTVLLVLLTLIITGCNQTQNSAPDLSSSIAIESTTSAASVSIPLAIPQKKSVYPSSIACSVRLRRSS